MKCKIMELFQQLKEEEIGKYVPGSGFKYILPPDGMSYYNKVSGIVKYAKELATINGKYHITELVHTFSKEVEHIRDFQYEYDNKGKAKSSSINNIIHLMQNTTKHIFRDFVVQIDDRPTI